MPELAILLAALEHYRHVANTIEDARRQTEDDAKTRHERCNVFTTLLKEHDEVRLHTRFIHNLLDPKGNHDCGPRFLELFFETLANHPGLDHAGQEKPLPALSLKQWVVQREASRSPYGQIDILIEQAGRFGIAIENKIYAAEQGKQLAGYAGYLNEKFSGKAILIYLTLNGRQSETHDGSLPCLLISYADHILTWLDKCLWETVRIPPINQILLQYRDVVRKLTGKTVASNTMKEIVHYIHSNPDIIRYRQQINAAIEVARAEFLDSFADAITKQLKEKGYNIVPFHKMSRFPPHGGALILTPLPASELNRRGFQIWIENYWEIIVGIKFLKGYKTLSVESQLVIEKAKAILANNPEAQISHREVHPDAWPAGCFTLFKADDDNQVAEFVNKNLSVTAKNMCATILHQIGLLENAFMQAASTTHSPSAEILQ